jgi:hypothetical protein
MAAVNGFVAWAVGVLLLPFQALPSLAALAAFSFLTALGTLLVFKRVANQEALAEVKRQMSASIFEMRLYSHDLPVILRSQAGVFRHTLGYLRLSLVPMLLVILPIALMLAHLHPYYGHASLRPGDSTILTVRIGAPGSERPDIRLEVPAALEVETPGVWAPALGEMAWRVGVKDWGEHTIRVAVGESTVTKAVDVSEGLSRRSSIRPGPSLAGQFLHPSEPPLPPGAVSTVAVGYPENGLGWLAWFFVFTAIFVLLLRRPLRVTI